MKTFLPKAADLQRTWFLVDAANQPVGRLAVRIANLLRGRGKPIFTPHIDTGDFVVVVNAEKVALTGRKEEQKLYWRHSRYRGGRTTMTAAQVRARQPARLVEQAVKGMLPKSHLSREVIKRLKLYAGTEHPHAAQQPKAIELK